MGGGPAENSVLEAKVRKCFAEKEIKSVQCCQEAKSWKRFSLEETKRTVQLESCGQTLWKRHKIVAKILP